MPYLTQLPSKKWRAVYRGRDGRRRSITRPTKAEARAEALERESEVRRGTWQDPDLAKMSFDVWRGRWAKGRVVEGNTQRKNDSHLRNHITPRWGKVPLDGIERLGVQEWVADMQRRKVGAETISAVVGLFGKILQEAVEHELLRTNPARGISLPTPSKQPDRVVSDDELAAVVATLGEQDLCLVELIYSLGLRWGEAVGLHTHRVALDRLELQVVEVLTRHEGVKDYPKSKKSRRLLPLTEDLAVLLKAQMDGRPPRSLVFTQAEGKPLDYTNWRRRVWVPAVKDAGIAQPWPTIHDLRHSRASHLIAGGIDVASVQAFMGHESLLTTSRYVHAAPSARDKIRRVLNERAAENSPDTDD